MIRADSNAGMLASFVNRCGYKSFNNSETGEPFTEMELQRFVDQPELTLDEAMKKW